MPTYNKKIVYLSDAQRQELFANGSIVVGGETFTYDPTDIYVTPQGVNMSIGTVSTLPAGSSATAAIRGTVDNPILDLGIPKGDQGDDAEAENGLPSGGTTGQVLKKTGSADYAAGWSGMALNDLSDVNVTSNRISVLTYNPGLRKWLADKPSPFMIGEIYEHYDETLQDLDGKGYIDLTYAAENPSGNPVYSSYCQDSSNIHESTDGLFEVYWTTNTQSGLESIYLIDRAAGTPFEHAVYRYDYDSEYGTWVEAPLANTNEVTGFWTGTQAQYDALATKDAHKVYFIQE